MNNGKNKINEAFGNVDSVFIESTLSYQKRGKNRAFRIIAFVACVALALSIIPIGMIIANKKEVNTDFIETQQFTDAENERFTVGDISDLGWEVILFDGLNVQKQKTGVIGAKYVLDINYGEREIFSKCNSDADICAELLGQWIVSLFCFDYDLHFSLFPEQLLADYVYVEFAEEGMTKEQALNKITQVASDVIPLENVKIQYSIKQAYINDSSVTQEFIEKERSVFERIGMDVNKIEGVIKFTIEDAAACFDELWVYEDEYFDYGEDYIFYKYDGRWYAERHLLDDDLSIDFLKAEEENNHGYYKIYKCEGKITDITNGYICLHDNRYFRIAENEIQDFSIGDNVKIQYYNVLAYVKRISDGKRCLLYTSVSVEKQ
ncbi:MAG: hypothetical protein IJZ83_00730 [Clostridia bacterium]|nr:hypothetical protein [Clostridia bacterium]